MFNKKIFRDIKDKFQLTMHSCKPTVNEKVDNSSNRTNVEIACLIAQYKNIYFTSKPHILNNLDLTLQGHALKLKRIDYFQYFLSKFKQVDHKIIMAPFYEKESRTILYNNSGTRQAFLLYLRDMEISITEFYNPGSWAESDNHYLTGLLLCYSRKDILFFYKVAAFKDHLLDNDKTLSLASTEKKSFASWSPKIKQNFYDFLKSDWHKSDTYRLYKRDRKEAFDWLKESENCSLKKIKVKIQKLENQIEALNKLSAK